MWSNALLAAVISFQATTAAPAQTLYRIDLKGNQTVWSQDQPKVSGSLLLFHRYPGGTLVSVKKSDVQRVTASRRAPERTRGLRPGGEIDIGITGGEPSAAASKAGPDGSLLAPGERKDGSALLNPDRRYRPDWDSKQVPGSNLPFPASANDYREGRTFAYPPASAVQQAPGEPPTMPQGSGEPPKGPQ